MCVTSASWSRAALALALQDELDVGFGFDAAELQLGRDRDEVNTADLCTTYMTALGEFLVSDAELTRAAKHARTRLCERFKRADTFEAKYCKHVGDEGLWQIFESVLEKLGVTDKEEPVLIIDWAADDLAQQTSFAEKIKQRRSIQYERLQPFLFNAFVDLQRHTDHVHVRILPLTQFEARELVAMSNAAEQPTSSDDRAVEKLLKMLFVETRKVASVMLTRCAAAQPAAQRVTLVPDLRSRNRRKRLVLAKTDDQHGSATLWCAARVVKQEGPEERYALAWADGQSSCHLTSRKIDDIALLPLGDEKPAQFCPGVDVLASWNGNLCHW